MVIPTVGVVDSNCDPAYLTYLIPANDDTPQSVDYLLRLFYPPVSINSFQPFQNSDSERAKASFREGKHVKPYAIVIVFVFCCSLL